MVVLIAGCSHSGKTLLAQKLLEKYKYPYLSIDHLKMGLIRSGMTELTPEDDDALTALLWPVLREIVKIAIENRQNLIIEGCYIPFDWKKDFTASYEEHIRYYCLVMTEKYVREKFEDIKAHAHAVEKRQDNAHVTREMLLRENAFNLAMCKKYGHAYVLIDEAYRVDIELTRPSELSSCPPSC